MPLPALQHLSAIVLAAGQSVRMGGPNKLLQPLAGQPLLSHALKTVAGLHLGQVVVVTGRDGDDVARIARSHGLQTVHNKQFEHGMGTSIAAGANALRAEHAGVFVHLGDLPFVSRTTFHALSDALTEDAKQRIDAFVPECGGVRGHPVLFRASLIGELGRFSGDEGARRTLAARNCRRVCVSDPDIAHDVDTMEDLAALTLPS